MARVWRRLVLALTALAALAANASAKDSGLKQRLLASPGEVHDGVIAVLGQDPRYEVKDSGDRLEGRIAEGENPYSVLAVIRKGGDTEQTELEIVYQGQGSSEQKRAFERGFLRQVTEAIKYAETGYNRLPDLKSPLDVGPRADNTPRVPAVDDVRRY